MCCDQKQLHNAICHELKWSLSEKSNKVWKKKQMKFERQTIIES